MKIIKDYPPNIEKIRERFGEENIGNVFAYDGNIYCPDKEVLPDHLIAHEKVHIKQQGDESDAWWERYLESDHFRLIQEVEAYQEQYNVFLEGNKDRNEIARFLRKIARDLSGKMYGNIIKYKDARDLISGG